MFSKLLIANRGEIACRVIKTAGRMGLETVAIYSEADAAARHVRLAGEAVCVGPAPARESYLCIDRIIAAAKRTGAQAVHPGYGFLSENEDFAEACAAAGLVFVGPPAKAIRAMGSKAAAKALMAGAGVPLVPGYHGEDQDAALLQREAARIGYPVLIKASAGGGGKGMRIVESAERLAAALAACQREATASFGDGRVLVEKSLQRPRQLEIQVFADAHGNCVHLFERDCSVQRRHQKVLEEAPAPGLTEERRREMGAAAIAAARAVGYVGAGTVEFIVDPDGGFYFMEMNTRLQVEHPVTEMITGLDLVEWQLRVAAGELLPLAQVDITRAGHAIEARIYAEDPARDFLPSTGKLGYLSIPEESRHVRVDTGVCAGDTITPHYDPMIAKLIVWDESREQALARMAAALARYRISGVTCNVEFLGRLVTCPAFATGDLDTGLIARESVRLFPERAAVTRDACFAATLAVLAKEVQAVERSGERSSPWVAADGWRLNSVQERTLHFRDGEAERLVQVRYEKTGYRLTLEGSGTVASGMLQGNAALRFTFDGVSGEATVVEEGDRLDVFLHGRKYELVRARAWNGGGETAAGDAGLTAPIPGHVVALLAEPGAFVEQGAPLLVLEAMKMEMTIVAPTAGTVRAFRFPVGAQVAAGAELVEFEKRG